MGPPALLRYISTTKSSPSFCCCLCFRFAVIHLWRGVKFEFWSLADSLVTSFPLVFEEFLRDNSVCGVSLALTSAPFSVWADNFDCNGAYFAILNFSSVAEESGGFRLLADRRGSTTVLKPSGLRCAISSFCKIKTTLIVMMKPISCNKNQIETTWKRRTKNDGVGKIG